MAKDRIGNHFEKKQNNNRLDEMSRKSMTAEEIEAEEQMIENAEKVEPIKNEGKTGRNDPCPCGSGKKYKKCCMLNE